MEDSPISMKLEFGVHNEVPAAHFCFNSDVKSGEVISIPLSSFFARFTEFISDGSLLVPRPPLDGAERKPAPSASLISEVSADVETTSGT